MAIERLPKPVRDYVAAFDLVAIARTRDGRLIATRDPHGVAAAWWCEADKAGAVVKRARSNGGDVVGAARTLGVALTEHATVLARAGAAVNQIDVKLAKLQQSGGLQKFNREYRARRLAAEARGRRFMTYNTAWRRLKAMRPAPRPAHSCRI